MSKEMTIVFVYDTKKQDGFEDPVKSVIYFHPSWVSEMQKVLLCGQLMGTVQFLNETFWKPRTISLQSGKFAIKSFGRFFLAVGSDRNILEDVLEHRANFLYTLLKLYHSDLNVIYEQTNSKDKHVRYADKIYTILESYLPLLQCNGNIFQNVSSLKIPKSASNLYMETSQILQSFQQVEGVLGGTMLYHNKVVASQLPDCLTKILTLSDLYRLNSSEYITANYHVPVGVTLINAYIPTSDYAKLLRISSQSYNLFVNSVERDAFSFQLRRKSFTKDTHSLMKRDKSLIFTNIPEEDMEDTNGSVKLLNKKKNNARPTNLPLFLKYQTALETTESGFNSINFDDSDSFPNFIGKTSVCSTPMTENKLLSHSNLLSICAVNEDTRKISSYFNHEYEIPLTDSSEEKNDLLKHKDEEQFNTCFNNFISKPHFLKTKSTSLSNLNDVNIAIDVQAFENTNGINIPRMKTLMHNNLCKTVADPIYPIVSTNGNAVSYSIFKELLETHYNNLMSCTDTIPSKNLFDSVAKSRKEFVKITNNDPNSNNIMKNTIKSRREMYLPIKTMNSDVKYSERTQINSVFDPPAHRRKMTGLQLTPLMSKLTFINSNNDLQSSGFSSNDTTPGCNFNNPSTPLEYHTKLKKSKSIVINSGTTGVLEQDIAKLVKVEMFICVQQNMTLVLLLQEKSCEKEDMINTLFETCVSKLPRIENSLHQVMSINVESCDKGDGNYSFISLDSKWDVKNRCGPWIPNDLLTLNSLHHNFQYNRKLIECILKSQETVLYAYRCGRSEIYYQQPSVVHSGLPIPQDAMGTVALCAKRRLERDHGILLL